MLEAVLLTVALSLPPPWYPPETAPETTDERAARVELIVRAAVAAAETPPEGWPGSAADLAAAVLAKTWHESRRWALEVHEGRVRGDPDPATGVGRSCGLGQLWDQCEHVGTSHEQTRAHLRDVAEILAGHAHRCQVQRLTEWSVARIFGAYGRGNGCDPLQSSLKRARLWVRFREGRAITAPPSSCKTETARWPDDRRAVVLFIGRARVPFDGCGARFDTGIVAAPDVASIVRVLTRGARGLWRLRGAGAQHEGRPQQVCAVASVCDGLFRQSC